MQKKLFLDFLHVDNGRMTYSSIIESLKKWVTQELRIMISYQRIKSIIRKSYKNTKTILFLVPSADIIIMVIVPQQRNALLQLALTLLLLLPLQISSFTLKIPSQHPPSSTTLKLTLQQPQRHNSVKRNKIVLKSTLEIEPSEINNLSNETTIISTNIDSTAATNDDIFVVTNDDKDASTSTSTITDKKKEKLSYPLILWRFTRPHTLIGSAIAIPSIHLLSASSISTIFSTQFVYSILYALIPSLLMNVYITGLNQLTDVNIDKINKPTLPLASGDLSMMEGVIIVLSCLAVSLGMGLANPIFGSMGLNITLWVRRHCILCINSLDFTKYCVTLRVNARLENRTSVDIL